MIRRALVVALLLLLPLASWAPPLPRRAAAPGGGGTPTWESTGAQGTVTGGNNITVPVASGVQSGDMLVVVVALDGGNHSDDISCTGYTVHADTVRHVGNDGTGCHLSVHWKTAGASETDASCTFGGVSEDGQGYMLRYSGATSLVHDPTWETNVNSDSALSIDPTDPATLTNSMVISSVCTDGQPGTVTGPGEVTVRANTQFGAASGSHLGAGDVLDADGTSQTISAWTWTSGEKASSVVVRLDP